MALDPISNIAGAVKGIIDKFVPDANEKLKMQLELATKEIVQEHERLLAQINVNAEEAKNPSIFVAGWRPAIGWICAIALALNYWPRAVVATFFWCVQAYSSGTIPPFPDLGTTALLGLVGSMLGVVGIRSLDKWLGTDAKGVSLK